MAGEPFVEERVVAAPPPGYSSLIIDLLCPSERREKFQRLLSGELRFLLRDEVATLLELASLYVLGDRLPHRYNVAHECFASPGSTGILSFSVQLLRLSRSSCNAAR